MAEHHEHHDQGGHVQEYVVQNRHIPEPQEVPGQNQVARRGDGQELGHSLQSAENNRLERIHLFLRLDELRVESQGQGAKVNIVVQTAVLSR